MKRFTLALLLLGLYLLSGEALDPRSSELMPASSHRFERITDEAGLHGSHNSYGITVLDIDADDLPDLYLCRHQAEPQFFRNRPEQPGFFEAMALDFEGWDTFRDKDHHVATATDVDADGCVDLFQPIGSSRGTFPADNRLLSMSCGFDPIDITSGSGLEDPAGRARLGIWFDFNVDGAPDLLLLNAWLEGQPSMLLRGRGDGTFEEAGAGSGLPLEEDLYLGWAADLDDDRLPDLLFSGDGLKIFRNLGDGSFENVTALTGIDVDIPAPRIVLGDIDGDLATDLIVGGASPERDLLGMPDSLEIRYRSFLDEGETEEIEFRTGSDSLDLLLETSLSYRPVLTFFGRNHVNPAELPLRIAADDTVMIGEPSISDSIPGTYVWRDEGTDRWHLRWRGGTIQGFTVDHADGVIGTDAPIDSLRSIGLEPLETEAIPLRVFLADGPLSFREVSDSSGLQADPRRTRDLSLGDLDNDGDLDLVVVNGALVANEPMQIFMNQGQGTFVERTAELGIAPQPKGSGDAAALADFDRDGDLDLLVVNGAGHRAFTGPYDLYRARGVTGRWLQIALRSMPGRRTPLGTRIEIVAGGKRQIRFFDAGIGNQGQDEAVLHFGLADAEQVDTLFVRWPDGSGGFGVDVAADRLIGIGVSW